MMTTTYTAQQAADFKWLTKAEDWGEWERFDETTGERESIWMRKSGSSPEVRFYAIGQGQIGPRHSHVVGATCWAYANGYLQVCAPEDIWLEIACRKEVLAGGVARGANGSGVAR